MPTRTLDWAVLTTDGGAVRLLPLGVAADSSSGGQALGSVQLRLPSLPALMAPPDAPDPMFAGTGGTPPELPVDVTADRLVMWLTLTTAEAQSFRLAWLGINAVDVVAQVIEQDQPLGTATGGGDLGFALRGTPVDPASLQIQLWQGSSAAPWTAIDNFGRAGPQDTVFVLDPAAGTVTFGDGIRGLRPQSGSVIVASRYAWGGGASGNLAAGSIKAIAPAIGAVRHEWATSGGSDGETVEQGERRIPAFLSTRDRAVTIEDFQQIALATPGLRLGRAELVPGLMPGAVPETTRTGIPGVVSIFVFPAAAPGPGGGPVATLGQLRAVFAYLRARVLVGTQLFVLSAVPRPVAVSVGIEVAPGADPVATAAAIRIALIDYLWPLQPGGPEGAGWPLGRAIAADELVTQVARAPGVLAVAGLSLYGGTPGNWTNAATVTLQPWEVAPLAAITIGTDGTAPSGPPDSDAAGDAAAGQLVPYVPPVC